MSTQPVTPRIQIEEKQRLVIRGSAKDGRTVVLEAVGTDEDPVERLHAWSNKRMSEPFHHDVHLSMEVVTTIHERLNPDGTSHD